LLFVYSGLCVTTAVNAKAHTTVGYGIVAAGSLVPPKLSNFGLFASMNGSLDGVMTVNASATVRGFLLAKKNI
jgi:hypothetical protein